MTDLLAYVAYFFTGALLINALPHLAAGVQGQPFPSPFAKPSGVGDSSPVVNVLWGLANLFGGLVLLASRPAMLVVGVPMVVAMLGAVVLGVFAGVHFGRVRQHKRPVS